MKRVFVFFVCICMIVSLFSGCNVGGGETLSKTEQALQQIHQLGSSPDDNYRTWYEIFVYSFCDSNGDGIGDLQGVLSKLDYLQDLGITGIWLMPIHPSTSYHKYNVTDYYEIDPTYGTMADFDALIAECDKRNIKVIIDLVLNHSGSTHTWFQQAVNYLKSLKGAEEPLVEDCKYIDYYNFVTTRSVSGNGAYKQIPGTKWSYEAQFSTDMPDLNLASDYVRAEIKDIMKFWLDKGVAGFRLDAVKEFYSGSTDPNVEVLSFLQETAESIKPDAYLVGECWDSFAKVTDFYKSGINSLFNFPFGTTSGKIVDVVRGSGSARTVSSYASVLEMADKAYRENNPDYIDAPFLSNHDVGRIAGFVSRNPNKTKLAGAMNLLMSGGAFIYYGEEIGMVSGGENDPSKRAPMYWNAERNNGTTNPPPQCTLPSEYPFGSLEEQKTDDNSIYNYYRQAIAIRNALPVISHGAITVETSLNVGCVSAQRKTWNDQECIILMNIDVVAAQVDLSSYQNWKLAATLSADGNEISMDGTTLNMAAFGIAILIPAAE